MPETSMDRISHVSARALWSGRVYSENQKREQLTRYFAAIRSISPLLSSFSPQGKKFGWGPMLKQPLIADMDDRQWHKVLKNSEEDGHQVLSFWNRHKDDARRIYTHFFSPQLWDYGYCLFSNMPSELISKEALKAITQAMIGSFEPDHVEIATFNTMLPLQPIASLDELVNFQIAMRLAEREGGVARYAPCYRNVDVPLWLRWRRQGVEVPEPTPVIDDMGKPDADRPTRTYQQLWQSVLPSEDSECIGGVLQIWPQFAPWVKHENPTRGT